jgi:hypothetical protein
LFEEPFRVDAVDTYVALSEDICFVAMVFAFLAKVRVNCSRELATTADASASAIMAT